MRSPKRGGAEGRKRGAGNENHFLAPGGLRGVSASSLSRASEISRRLVFLHLLLNCHRGLRRTAGFEIRQSADFQFQASKLPPAEPSSFTQTLACNSVSIAFSRPRSNVHAIPRPRPALPAAGRLDGARVSADGRRRFLSARARDGLRRSGVGHQDFGQRHQPLPRERNSPGAQPQRGDEHPGRALAGRREVSAMRPPRADSRRAPAFRA